ncbi:MAG TPA: DnaJ C-terminal domain-containing protein, partial [Chloroflexota bacterium]|nr:DnaJ C-terminal domain-containing protein [Chloroflexota bacterium]
LMDLTISARDAAEGITVDVPTLKGDKRLRIPGGVRDGQLVRIGGAGIRPQGMLWHRGDQFVIVHIAPLEDRDAAL